MLLWGCKVVEVSQFSLVSVTAHRILGPLIPRVFCFLFFERGQHRHRSQGNGKPLKVEEEVLKRKKLQ